MRAVAEIAKEEAIRLETMAALLPVIPLEPAQPKVELARADAELARAKANHVRAKTEQVREERHAIEDEHKDAETKKRTANLLRAARVKIHPIGLAITLVVGVALLLLLLRYA